MHICASPHLDLAAARDIGFRCVWIDRGSGREPLADYTPDSELATLDKIAAQLAQLRLGGSSQTPSSASVNGTTLRGSTAKDRFEAIAIPIPHFGVEDPWCASGADDVVNLFDGAGDDVGARLVRDASGVRTDDDVVKT